MFRETVAKEQTKCMRIACSNVIKIKKKRDIITGQYTAVAINLAILYMISLFSKTVDNITFKSHSPTCYVS